MAARRTPSPMLMTFLSAGLGIVCALVIGAVAWSASAVVNAPGAIDDLERRMENVEKLVGEKYPASDAHRTHDEMKDDLREVRARLRELERAR